MNNIFIKIIKFTTLIVFTVWFSIISMLLCFVPNDYLLLLSLSHVDADIEYNNEATLVMNLMPNSIAKFFVYTFEDECVGTFTPNSYLTMLVDIYYDNFPSEGMNIDKVQTKEAIMHFIEMGCSLNQVHQSSKWGPIHSAFLFSPKDPEFAKELVVLGADPLLELPPKYKEKFKGDNALSILILMMNKKGSSEVYEQIYHFVLDHQQHQLTTKSVVDAPK